MQNLTTIDISILQSPELVIVRIRKKYLGGSYFYLNVEV